MKIQFNYLFRDFLRFDFFRLDFLRFDFDFDFLRRGLLPPRVGDRFLLLFLLLFFLLFFTKYPILARAPFLARFDFLTLTTFPLLFFFKSFRFRPPAVSLAVPLYTDLLLPTLERRRLRLRLLPPERLRFLVYAMFYYKEDKISLYIETIEESSLSVTMKSRMDLKSRLPSV